MKHPHEGSPTELVGLMPAAGFASRLGDVPCSKEVIPLGYWEVDERKSMKVACHYLLERMKAAGVRAVHVVLRPDKWDIPGFLGSGRTLGMHFCYHVTEGSPGPVWSINEAYPFVKDRLVAFGFPDIIFHPFDSFIKLLERQSESGADVVLGVFPAARPRDMDMVDVDESGRVIEIQIKPDRTTLEYTWIIAVWTPLFTEFMNDYMAEATSPEDSEPGPDVFQVGDVLRAAVSANMRVEGVLFPHGRCRDVGTPEDLIQSMREA